MKVPSSVSIAGHRIPVMVRNLETEEVYGQYLPERKVIELDIRLLKNHKMLRKILRHEMLEASLCLSGVGWSEKYDQEPIVRAIDEIFWPAWERVEKKWAKPPTRKSAKAEPPKEVGDRG